MKDTPKQKKLPVWFKIVGILGFLVICTLAYKPITTYLGPEGTNGDYYVPFDTRTETLRVIQLKPGAQSTDSILVHFDGTNYVRRIAPISTILGSYATTASLATVATSGSFLDLSNVPTIPTNNNQLINGEAFVNQAGARMSLSAGTGISYNNSTGVITNSSSDQTVSLTGANGIITSGTYPNFTISRKRQETYSGTTIAAGTYTVTFGTAYSVAPNIQANIINGTDTQNIRTTAISTTGFTVLVRNRVDVIGLLPSWNNVSGASVDVLITEK